MGITTPCTECKRHLTPEDFEAENRLRACVWDSDYDDFSTWQYLCGCCRHLHRERQRRDDMRAYTEGC